MLVGVFFGVSYVSKLPFEALQYPEAPTLFLFGFLVSFFNYTTQRGTAREAPGKGSGCGAMAFGLRLGGA